MSKKIDFRTISTSSVANIRLSLYPAEKELAFWKGIAKSLISESEEITVLSEAEVDAYNVLNARIVKETAYWEGVLKEKRTAMKALISADMLKDVKRAADLDDDKLFNDVFIEWFRKLGVNLDAGIPVNQMHKHTEILIASCGQIIKENRKGNLTTAGAGYLRNQLVKGLVKILVNGRKQFEIVGSYLEPDFRLRKFENVEQ